LQYCGNKLLLYHCLKRAIVPLLAIIDLFFFLNIFSKVFEFTIYDHLFNFFKHSLNPAQHSFRESNSTTINSVIYLNSIIPCVSTQGQTVSVYILIKQMPSTSFFTFSFVNLVILDFLLVKLIGSIAI
jgi:hypothetical protein